MGLLDNLLGRAKASPRLDGLIADYPPYVPPFVKPPASVTVEQAEANLADLLRVRPARLERFGTLLSAFGIDLEAGLAAGSPEPLLDALWRWTLAQFPSIYDPSLAAYGARRTALGGSPVFGVVTDLGLVLGECVVRHGAGYAWALDLDAGNKAMPSYRQPCVIGATVFDALLLADSAYANCQKGGYRFANDLRRAVMNCVGGAVGGAAPAARRVASTLYDKAGDHIGEQASGDGAEEWGASHLALFVAWLALHDMLSATLAERAKPLKDRAVRPLAWLNAERDGALAEVDLSDAGNRFARQYFGTPAEGLHDGPGSFLRDFIDTLKDGDDDVLIEDSWENYARLAPVIDGRYAAFRESETA